MKILLSCLIAAIATRPCADGQALSSQSVSSVRIQAFTLAGVPASGAKVTLASVGPVLSFSGDGANTAFTGVPFGLYDLEVRLPGFEVRKQRIRVYQKELAFRVGLELTSTHFYQRPELSGSIKAPPSRAGTNLWIRLMPLYSSDFVENAVDGAGRFELDGMAVGKYVLLVFQNNQILATQAVDVTEGKQSVEITLRRE